VVAAVAAAGQLAPPEVVALELQAATGELVVKEVAAQDIIQVCPARQEHYVVEVVVAVAMGAIKIQHKERPLETVEQAALVGLGFAA